MRRGASLLLDYPFTHDLGLAKQFAAMGVSLAGQDGKPPIVWPDMKKIEQAARVPMTEETKERLRAISRDRSVGDQVAAMLAAAKDRPALAKIACEYLGLKETPDDIIKKYAHLDNGRFRMTLGNRMRAKWKASDRAQRTEKWEGHGKEGAAPLPKPQTGDAGPAGVGARTPDKRGVCAPEAPGKDRAGKPPASARGKPKKHRRRK